MPYYKWLFSILFISGFHFNTFCQKVQLAEGSAEVIVGNESSVDEYIDRCTEKARINAIASLNGLTVLSEMSDITTQLNGNLQTNEFSQVNEVRIAGYWLKDSCKPFVVKQINEEGNGILSCTVKGYIKKRNPEKELIIYAMDCPDIKCSKMVYSSGQHLYVNVVSACEGYISIWLEDVGEKKVYRLIQGRKIIQGKATVFFDSGDDEVLLNSEGEHEKGIHRLFVIRTKIQENYFHAAGKSYLWEGGLKSIIPDYMDSDKFIIQLLQKQLLCDDIEMKSVVINVIK